MVFARLIFPITINDQLTVQVHGELIGSDPQVFSKQCNFAVVLPECLRDELTDNIAAHIQNTVQMEVERMSAELQATFLISFKCSSHTKYCGATLDELYEVRRKIDSFEESELCKQAVPIIEEEIEWRVLHNFGKSLSPSIRKRLGLNLKHLEGSRNRNQALPVFRKAFMGYNGA